jgi:hypothetical protein
MVYASSMEIVLVVVLKLFGAIPFFLAAHFLARFVMRFVPEGPLRRRLLTPLGGKR